MTVWPVFDGDLLIGVFSTSDKAKRYVDDNEEAYSNELFVGVEQKVDELYGVRLPAL